MNCGWFGATVEDVRLALGGPALSSLGDGTVTGGALVVEDALARAEEQMLQEFMPATLLATLEARESRKNSLLAWAVKSLAAHSIREKAFLGFGPAIGLDFSRALITLHRIRDGQLVPAGLEAESG